MSLSREKATQAVMLCKCGGHPTLIALYLVADPRSVVKKLAEYHIFGPWPKVPLKPPSSTFKTQARAILKDPMLLLSIETTQLLKNGNSHLNSDACNLLLRALIGEREQRAINAA